MGRYRALGCCLIGGVLLCCGFGLGKDAEDEKTDERRLETARLKTDGETLLNVFRKRTLNEEELEKVKAVIRQLGDESFKVREHAVADLVSRGPVVAELLKAALSSSDLEVTRRAERCLQRIKEKDFKPGVLPAAVRLVARQKPAQAAEVLLAYLPYADNEEVADEVRSALTALAVRDGKTDPALVKGLTDKLPIRRAAAGEALCRANVADQKAAVQRLLHDPDPSLRLRVAMALANTGQRDAVPVLIDAMPDVSQVLAWQGEDILLRLADGRDAPAVSLGPDPAARRKARDAWSAWWKANGSMIDLAKLHERPALLGYTVVVLLDEGEILELGKKNQVRWQIKDLQFPLDVQVLPGDRILIAEYQAQRITERNQRGEILWEEHVQAGPQGGPLVGQRLPNGNTFIATANEVYEVDRNHRTVFSHPFNGIEQVMKAVKLARGDVVCLTTGLRVVRLDASGREVYSFPVGLGQKLHGGRIDVLPNGHVLVPHNAENKVAEYDSSGTEVWKVTIEEPVAAVRLANGNTLVTTMSQHRAVEFDREGKEVWQYRTNTRVTRALRR
jgi:PQQ-like domain/HEAT repeats